MLIVIAFSNAVQLVIAIIAPVKRQTRIVQTSLIAGVISNGCAYGRSLDFFSPRMYLSMYLLEQNLSADTVGSSFERTHSLASPPSLYLLPRRP